MSIRPNGALAEILARDQENGVDIFDDGGRPRRPVPGPPAHLEPLRRPVFPAPNWREQEATASKALARTAEDPEPPPKQSLAKRPAKKQAAKKRSPTPNLDLVRSWLEEDR